MTSPSYGKAPNSCHYPPTLLQSFVGQVGYPFTTMPKLPTVAIIGRPNAGKSTLFNALTGTRQAIVSDVPGTTRDHVASKVTGDIDFLLVDTGGVGGGSQDKDLESDVAAQSLIALREADVILFAVSIRDELTRSDLAVTDMLRKHRKRHVPVVLALTKADNAQMEDRLPEFYALNIADTLIAVSAMHRQGIDELLAAITECLKDLHFSKSQEGTVADPPRIALVGRPNVGKSSLINAYMSDADRKKSARLVSDIPGTTRDPSDTVVRHDGKEFIFVDTAGMRRKTKVETDIEGLSNFKSLQAISNCDIVVMVLEAPELISRQEKRIAAHALEEGKGLILLVNKADLLTGEERVEREQALRFELPFCKFAPVLFASAMTRDGLLKLFPLLESVHRNLHRRIGSAELRKWYDGALQKLPAKALSQGKHLTQAKDIPPTFVLFVRDAGMIQRSQLRYLEGSLRTTFAFEGAPIRWITKQPHD